MLDVDVSKQGGTMQEENKEPEIRRPMRRRKGSLPADKRRGEQSYSTPGFPKPFKRSEYLKAIRGVPSEISSSFLILTIQ